ncbi:MAG TPA: ProQ/FinO family protein [Gammaproteobacteria bacterium]|nr:ProQ/FinO family protein [Gammaproteobacteria bacterium]
MSNTANQKKRRAERTRAFLNQLMERYPACFVWDRKTVRPLAIGIQERLREDLNNDPEWSDTPNWLIKQALARYTHAPSYLEAIVAGRSRVTLDGSDAGDVTDEARQHARERREEQKKLAAQRRHRARKERERPSRDERQRRKLERLAEKFNST